MNGTNHWSMLFMFLSDAFSFSGSKKKVFWLSSSDWYLLITSTNNFLKQCLSLLFLRKSVPYTSHTRSILFIHKLLIRSILVLIIVNTHWPQLLIRKQVCERLRPNEVNVVLRGPVFNLFFISSLFHHWKCPSPCCDLMSLKLALISSLSREILHPLSRTRDIVGSRLSFLGTLIAVSIVLWCVKVDGETGLLARLYHSNEVRVFLYEGFL